MPDSNPVRQKAVDEFTDGRGEKQGGPDDSQFVFGQDISVNQRFLYHAYAQAADVEQSVTDSSIQEKRPLQFP